MRFHIINPSFFLRFKIIQFLILSTFLFSIAIDSEQTKQVKKNQKKKKLCYDLTLKVEIFSPEKISLDENLNLYLKRKYPNENNWAIFKPVDTKFKVLDLDPYEDTYTIKNIRKINIVFDTKLTVDKKKYLDTIKSISSEVTKIFNSKEKNKWKLQSVLHKQYASREFKSIPNVENCYYLPDSIEYLLGRPDIYAGEKCDLYQDDIVFKNFSFHAMVFFNYSWEISNKAEKRRFILDGKCE